MNIKLFPDFDHIWQVGDRIIIEQTTIPVNGAPALITTNFILVPAGAKKGRQVIFVDDDEPQTLVNIQEDERGK
jgi:hypothetical protein